MRAALNSVATVAPDWLREQAPAEWFERYSLRVEESRLPKGEAELCSARWPWVLAWVPSN